ncbi:hypothetical protein PInf_017618 [Phytophthora infestans]|nr:hypothetical protein PInf_017618 [Phytophthora infestans]
MSEIADFVRKHIDDSGIIYCLSKKDCEQTAEKLIKAWGLSTLEKQVKFRFTTLGWKRETARIVTTSGAKEKSS